MFSACIPTFTLYFFGFFARDSLPERAALLAVQVVVLIFTKARFCPFKTDAWGTVSVFNFAFMVMEKIGYFCSVFFALLLIHYRRERIGTVLKETSRLAAVLERLLKKRNTRDEAFARFFCRFVVIQCSLSCLCPIMGIIGVVDCSICGYGAMIMDFHYFMVASLLCMLLARTESLIVDVHYGAFTLTKVRDRFLKIQIIRALLSIDDHSREIAESINECFTEVNLAFFTVEMTIVVNTIISGINGPNVCECMTWFTMYCLNMFLRISRMSKLRRKAEDTASCLHGLFIENDDQQIREEIEIFSLQLLHRRVEFDACSFFKIDFALLNSMIGAVTTFIIILIQFQMAEQDLKSKLANSTHTA